MIGEVPVLVLVLVSLGALTLTIMRVPTFAAFGMPAIVGLLFLNGFSFVYQISISVIEPINTYTFTGVILWAVTGALCVESGLFARTMAGLYYLLGRSLTPEEAESWRQVRHGVPGTMIQLLIIATLPAYGNNHLLIIFSLPLIFLVFIFALIHIRRGAKRHQVKVHAFDAQGNSLPAQAAPLSVSLKTPGGKILTLAERSDALIALLPLGILALIMLVLVFATPAAMTDLGAIALLWIGLYAILSGNAKVWVSRAGLRSMREMAFVANQMVGVMLLLSCFEAAGWSVWMARWAHSSTSSVWMVLILTFGFAAAVGTFISAEAGTMLAVGFFAGAFSSAAAGAPSDALSATAASALLTVMLAATAVAGGTLARVLPPRDQPWPLRRAPIVGS